MVFRVDKNRDYCTINNTVLRDNRLSLKAKGLLVTMLSLPDDWDYSIQGLSSILKEGKDAVRAAVWELEQFGYVERVKDRSEGGQFSGYVYLIKEVPSFENTEVAPLAENPTTVNPTTEKPTTENPPQLNTKELSTKELTTTTKRDSIISFRGGLNQHVILNPEELRRLDAVYGFERVRLMIQRLDYHIEKTGTFYPDHFEVIRKWIEEDNAKLGEGAG